MKKRVLISGKVHDVGYRPFLLGVAESLEIERFYAENMVVGGEEVVEILIDADPDKIDEFIKIIKSKKPEKAIVENISVHNYEGYVMKTESYYRYITSMQLSKIATYGGYMLEKQDKMLEKQDKMLDKQDKMLDRQDTVLGKMDLMLDRQDKMLEKQDETIMEIRALREDIKSFMDERLRKIERDIKIIKEKLNLP